MPEPKSEHFVAGIVRDANSNILSGAAIVLTRTSSRQTLEAISNSKGEFIFNLKNLDAWSVGDVMTVKGSKATIGEKTETFTVNAFPENVVNLTLAYTSDIVIFYNDNTIKLNAAMLVDFEGNKITPSNPLPVTATSGNPLDKYRPSDTKIDDAIRYYGFLAIDGSWYIRRDNLTDKNDRPSRYVKGDSGYPANLTNRADLDYGYFNDVF